MKQTNETLEGLAAHNDRLVKTLMREHKRFLRARNVVNVILKGMSLDYNENSQEQYIISQDIVIYAEKVLAELEKPEKIS